MLSPSRAPRPQVATPVDHCYGSDSLFSSREHPLASPDLFWATRMKSILGQPEALSQPPRPSPLHPHRCDFGTGLTAIEYYRFTGNPWEDEFPPELRRAWKGRFEVPLVETFRRLVHGLPAHWGGGEVVVQRAGSTLESAQVTLHLVCPRTSEPLGSIEQELCFDDGEGLGHFVSIESTLGWDAERTLLENSVELYDRLGLSSLKLECDGQRAYTWAKCGFVPESEEDAWELFSELEERLEALDLTPRTRTLALNLLADHQPEAVWALSDLDRVRVTVDGGRTSLGRALLEGTSWPATLNLEDAVAMERLARNIRRV